MSTKVVLFTFALLSLLLLTTGQPSITIITPAPDSHVALSASILVAGTAADTVRLEISLHNENNSITQPTVINATGFWEILFPTSNVTAGPMMITAVASSASGVFVSQSQEFVYGLDSTAVNTNPGVTEVHTPPTASASPSPVRPLPPLPPGVHVPSAFTPLPSVSPVVWTQPGWGSPVRGWDGQVIPVMIDGETLCYLRIPNVVLAQRDLDYRASLGKESDRQGDITLNVDLYDDKKQSIHQLERPLTICIRQFGEISDVECLGFFNEEIGEWECQDKALVFDEVADMLCGQTDHLTQFSLLLTGGAGSSSGGYTIAWISLGFAGGAILFFLAGALLVEMYRYKETLRRRTILAEIQSQMAAATL